MQSSLCDLVISLEQYSKGNIFLKFKYTKEKNMHEFLT